MRLLAFLSRGDSGKDCGCKDALPVGQTSPDYVITLVHGTKARHATWMQAKSELCKALLDREQLHGTALIRRFCWSGGNSHTARLRAAERLKNHLRSLLDNFPSIPHFVIAHSHGGNVVFYALQDETLRRKLAGVVTLATPFLQLRARALPRFLFWFGLLAVSFALLAAGLHLVYRDASAWLLVVTAVVLFGFTLCLLIFVSSVLAYRVRQFPAVSLLKLRRRVFLDEELRRFRHPPIDFKKLLILRPVGDEASGVLVAAQFLSWALTSYMRFLEWVRKKAWALWRGVVVVIGFVLIAVVVVNLFGVKARELIPPLGQAEPWVGVIGSLFWSGGAVALGMAALLGTVLLLLATAPFGWDAIFWSLFAATTAEPSPPGPSRVVQVGMDLDDHTGLVHSRIYENSEAIREIAKWIAQ